MEIYSTINFSKNINQFLKSGRLVFSIQKYRGKFISVYTKETGSYKNWPEKLTCFKVSKTIVRLNFTRMT